MERSQLGLSALHHLDSARDLAWCPLCRDGYVCGTVAAGMVLVGAQSGPGSLQCPFGGADLTLKLPPLGVPGSLFGLSARLTVTPLLLS